MAMLPFCGYHMADYWGHWLALGQREGARLPRVFYVNWFRKGPDGRFLWPGYGENSRVLAWIFRRCEGKAEAVDTEIGLLPVLGDGGVDVAGLDVSPQAMAELLAVDVEGWKRQLPQMHEHYAQFSSKLPDPLRAELIGLEQRLRG
jgi:phosphoenolpyruvate carboxykinase (GTP)